MSVLAHNGGDNLHFFWTTGFVVAMFPIKKTIYDITHATVSFAFAFLPVVLLLTIMRDFARSLNLCMIVSRHMDCDSGGLCVWRTSPRSLNAEWSTHHRILSLTTTKKTNISVYWCNCILFPGITSKSLHFFQQYRFSNLMDLKIVKLKKKC